MSRRDDYERLDRLAQEALGGADDQWLAAHANVTPQVVQAWKKKRKIRVSRKEAVDALDPYLRGWKTVAHRLTKGSVVGGRFEIPQMLLREPIHYDSFCKAVHVLHRDLEWSPEEIGLALGFRTRDVEMALALENARLVKVGVPCRTCGVVIDPSLGAYCGERCRP